MTLVLIPGLVCDKTVWQPQIAALTDLLPVFAAGIHRQESIETMASTLLVQVPGALIIVGHSLGGRVGLEMVRQAPTRINGLALLNSGYQRLAEGTNGEREIAGRQKLLDLAHRDGMRAMGAQWLPGMLHPDRRTDSELVNPLLSMIERCPLALFQSQIRALIGRPDAAEVLASLSCPTLVLCGEDDSWSPLSRHQEMARIVPHSAFVSVPGCGHMSTMERPNEVNMALREWLQSFISTVQ